LVLLLFDGGEKVVLIELAVGNYAAIVGDKLYFLSGVQWVAAAVG
jgi:hypothetical protein